MNYEDLQLIVIEITEQIWQFLELKRRNESYLHLSVLIYKELYKGIPQRLTLFIAFNIINILNVMVKTFRAFAQGLCHAEHHSIYLFVTLHVVPFICKYRTLFVL